MLIRNNLEYKRDDGSFGKMQLAEQKALGAHIGAEFEVLKKLLPIIEQSSRQVVPKISIQNELDLLENPSKVNELKYWLRRGHKPIESCHEQFQEGEVLDDRGFTLLHVIAEAGSEKAATLLGERRLKEFAMQALDGRKPLAVAIDRRLAAIQNNFPQEKLAADSVIAALVAIKEKSIRPLKRARTEKAQPPAEQQ